jgi:hypothetical protein
VDAKQAAQIREAANRACAGRTWLSCEPPQFFQPDPDGDGHLIGLSKPNFQPHPDDAASAAREGLPDGDVNDLLDVLSQLSRDGEIGHDAEPGAAGFIREGVCDPQLRQLSTALGDLAAWIAEFEAEGPPDDIDDDGEDDEDPPSVRFGNFHP